MTPRCVSNRIQLDDQADGETWRRRRRRYILLLLQSSLSISFYLVPQWDGKECLHGHFKGSVKRTAPSRSHRLQSSTLKKQWMKLTKYLRSFIIQSETVEEEQVPAVPFPKRAAGGGKAVKSRKGMGFRGRAEKGVCPQ